MRRRGAKGSSLRVRPRAVAYAIHAEGLDIVERARELLLASDGRIADIARQCGFADAVYFSRRFRQHMGLTPREFRAQSVARPGGPP